MGTSEPKDSVNGNDLLKNVGKSVTDDHADPVVKKRLPRKVRQIPEYYFLPRRSLPSAIAFYGSWIVAGVGAGMLAEVWMKKKVKGKTILYILPNPCLPKHYSRIRD